MNCNMASKCKPRFYLGLRQRNTISFPKLERKLVVLNSLRDSIGFNVVSSQGIFKGNPDYTQSSTLMRNVDSNLERTEALLKLSHLMHCT